MRRRRRPASLPPPRICLALVAAALGGATALGGCASDGGEIRYATGRKANLWATIGPADVPGFILSAHTDVVPVDGQAWSTDPFRLRRENGRLYGRGACDMKGFGAVCLVAAERMADNCCNIALQSRPSLIIR